MGSFIDGRGGLRVTIEIKILFTFDERTRPPGDTKIRFLEKRNVFAALPRPLEGLAISALSSMGSHMAKPQLVKKVRLIEGRSAHVDKKVKTFLEQNNA